MDDFLNEISHELYMEWLAFSHIQPLDPAYVIMRGLMGSPKQNEKAVQPWEQTKMNLIKHMNIVNEQEQKQKRRG